MSISMYILYTDEDIKMGLFQIGLQKVKNVEMELKKDSSYKNSVNMSK